MNTSSSPTASLRTESLRKAGVLVLALASGLACTAIFKPRDDVQRCGTSEDCEPTGDNRYVAACRFDPANTDLDSTEVDKICVADYDSIRCDAESLPPPQGEEEHPLQAKIDECDDLVLACDEDKLGSEGCERPPAGQCNAGLEPVNDVCVEEDSDETIVSDRDFLEQAIQDQFCKSFFCDEAFVCDTSSSNPTCVRCDPGEPFGEGGCGLLYANGEPAPFYRLGDDLTDNCANEDANPDEPLFGECPPPP